MIVVVEIDPNESHLKISSLPWMLSVVRFSFRRVSRCFSPVVGKNDFVEMIVSRLTYSSPPMYTEQLETWIKNDPTSILDSSKQFDDRVVFPSLMMILASSTRFIWFRPYAFSMGQSAEFPLINFVMH